MRNHDRHIFALQNWSVEKREKGWFIARTVVTRYRERHRWKGPYRSIASATLMIARELAKELDRRHTRSH